MYQIQSQSRGVLYKQMSNKTMTDEILPFRTGRKYLIRGTPEWDDREDSRKAAGNTTMSYGSFDELLKTKGKSAKHRALPEISV